MYPAGKSEEVRIGILMYMQHQSSSITLVCLQLRAGFVFNF